MYVCVCNKYCKIKKRQFSTCHIVWTKYLEFMRTDIHSIIRDYRKVYEQYSEFMRTEIHSIIRDYEKIFRSYADRDMFHYPGNFHPYVQPV